MDDKFLMGRDTPLVKSKRAAKAQNHLSSALHRRMVSFAMDEVDRFLNDFDPAFVVAARPDPNDYLLHLEAARRYGLFQPGGVREKDHLLFWYLSRSLEPSTYYESGIRAGSSFHAFADAPTLSTTVGIDPDLSQIAIPDHALSNTRLIDQHDFSELDIDVSADRALIYFDDHIDAARRIEQAHAKGFKYVVFDDAPGLEGLSQRLNPAFPTVPMIMEPELYQLGDRVEWYYRSNLKRPTSLLPALKKGVKRALRREEVAPFVKVEFTVDEALLAKCANARTLVKRYARLPNLADVVLPGRFEKMIDTSKYLLELQTGP